ncbi:protein Son [Uranotaenia lowii]|uniref:protein Son n=1 Tax=Uranotaenia lowii TaxID=190385 RepID=UPI002478AF4A|nr:protein Son [Uranotaenia lowii]XP_055593541.1 protein Son [Uranotaenia lowii]
MSENSPAEEETSVSTEMLPLNIKIKQEKITSYEDSSRSETVDKLMIDVNLPNPFATSSSSTSAPDDTAEKESKCVEPLKSSNEILTELFKVFNAAPPEIIEDDSNDEAESSKKKKKKHKKKSKKKKKSGSDSSSGSENGINEEEIKRKVKKIKKEKDKDKSKNKEKHKKHKDKEKEIKTEKHKELRPSGKPDVTSVVVKKETSGDRYHSRESSGGSKDYYHHHHHHHHYHSESYNEFNVPHIKKEKDDRFYKDSSRDDKDKERDRARDRDREREKEREKEKEDLTKSKNKIQIKSLKDSTIFKEVASKEKEREREERERERDRDRNRSRYPERDRSRPRELRKRRSDSEDFSLSEEEPYRSQGRYYDFYQKRYNSFYASYKEEEHNRGRKRRRSESRERHHRSRSKSRSRSPQFDKQKLLEIARKNAITMLKKGTLPGAQGLDKESKEKLIMKMKCSGKSVEELTEFCKKISDKENLNELSSVSSDDSEHEADGSSKAFHHPFQIKDPGPIVMNIKNSIPLQPKTAEQSKAIMMQFPVSSGAQHRKMESEWVPVEPKPAQPIPPVAVIRPEKFSTKASTPLAICAPPQAEQQPAYTPVNPVPGPQMLPPPATVEPGPSTAPVPPYMPVPNLENPPPPIASALPIPATIEPPPVQVFPVQQENNSLDVSTIISNRLNAMRKLQDNPADAEAIKLLYNTQKDMSAWASSKFTPGQFLGSTGVQCLSHRELAEGYQPWARRDTLKQTAPVSGGMGMHLLQKMGWVPGEGLGKEKNGSLEPLLLDVKLDKRGLVASVEEQQRQQHQIQFQMHQQHSGRRARFTNVKINTDGKHPVSILGEYCSKRKWMPPRYDMVHESGPGHAKNFIFKVIVNGLEYQPAIANNTKKEAKATSAKFCLQQLGILQ